MTRIAYIAGPYTSHATGYRTQLLEQCQRAAVLTRYAAELKLAARITVLSPVTHGHAIWMASGCELGRTALDWAEENDALIRAATEIHVLRLRGWQDSRGLRVELELFRRRGIDPIWVDLPETFYRHRREFLACHPGARDNETRPTAA